MPETNEKIKKVQSLEDLTFDEKTYIALQRLNLTNSKVARKIERCDSSITYARKDPKNSKYVSDALRELHKKVGLPV